LALRPVPVILLLAWSLQQGKSGAAVPERDTSRALVHALGARGLTADPADVRWVDTERGLWRALFGEPRAVLRARRPGEPADIFLVRARLSPEGHLLGVSALYNLSDTSAVDERGLVHDGARVSWLIASDNSVSSVHYLDLRGELPGKAAQLSALPRLQNAITNRQQTGQAAGVGRRSWKIEPAASHVALGFQRGALLITLDGDALRVDTDSRPVRIAHESLREQEHIKARPGNLVTWAVDRVRALPWFGSDRMQAVKAIAFAGLDWLERTQGAVTGDDGAERIAEEMSGIVHAPPTTYTDPETGWPPAPLVPVLSPALEGEGKWVLLDRDPFIRNNPGAPGAFAFSFIRTDRQRRYTQTYITLWDPRQVSLHAMSGTVEPKSATGETGPGLVPRTPEVLGRLVAGFNGGFQATHGEFGMMAENVVYLPPKPYGATVAELNDGSTGFGTWPNDDRVPEGIVSFRQNMTPLVADGVNNPYKREWWGGVPPGWTDESRTVRSGLCLTKEGFVAYFYGSSVDADRLALAMQRARCVYGIHLDMNPGHTGLEFYRADKAGALPDIGHPINPNWEAKSSIPGMPGWEFQGRRMIRYMGLMNFPRYIHRESRDFFYLTLRDVLPGVALTPIVTPAEPGEGAWQVRGLPQHGWPYAVTTSFIRPDSARPRLRVNLVKLDGSVLRASARRSGESVVSFRKRAVRATGAQSIWFAEGRFVSSKEPPPVAELIASGYAAHDPRASKAIAALGVSRANTHLVYAELASGTAAVMDGPLLDRLLTQLGCDQRVLLDLPLGVALGGERDLSGQALPAGALGLHLVRSQGPGGRRIFTDTPIVPVKEWYVLQAKRVRYMRKKAAPAASDGSGQPAPAPAAAPASSH
jgi:hypothetical protein